MGWLFVRGHPLRQQKRETVLGKKLVLWPCVCKCLDLRLMMTSGLKKVCYHTLIPGSECLRLIVNCLSLLKNCKQKNIIAGGFMVLLFICYALMATQPIMDHCRRDGRFLVRFFTLEGRFPFYLITRAVSMPHIGIFLNFKHFSVH